MLTRRQVLAGTAASSIAAIASARGVAAAAPGSGFDVGFGNLQDGAAAVFHKEKIGFSFFIKLNDSAAQIFYKEQILGEIGIFLKVFHKMELTDAAFHKMQWTLVDQFGGFLKDAVGAQAGFLKFTPSLAQIFLKFEDADQKPLEDVRTLENGLLLPAVDECRPNLE